MSDPTMYGTLPTVAAGDDPQSAMVRRIVREELSSWSKQQQTIGWVTGLDPLTVRLKAGGDVQVSLKNASMSLALDQRVSLIHTGAGYMITGLSAGPQDGQTIDHEHEIGDHEHAEADIVDIGTHEHDPQTLPDPALEIIENYVGNGTDDNIIFDNIPQTFKHLRVLGRLSHSNQTGSDIEEARLRFNADTGNNYHYANYNAAGITAAHTASRDQDRIFIQVGTVGGIDLRIWDYTGPSSILAFQLHSYAVFGTTDADNFTQRMYGGRYEIGGSDLTDIRLFLPDPPGEHWQNTTNVTLYGIRG